MTAPTQAPAQQRHLTAAQVATLIALVEAQARVRGQLTKAAIAGALAPFRALQPDDWWDSGKVDKAIRSALRVVQPTQTQMARITDAYLTRAGSLMTGRRVAPAGAVDVTRLRRDMPAQVARDLADGRVQPAFLLLGEHQPDQRRVVASDRIDASIQLAVPDPGETPTQRIRRQRAAQNAVKAQAIDPGEPYGRVADAFRFQVVAEGVSEDNAKRKALVRIAAVAETDVTLAVREQVRKSIGKIPGITGYRRILHPELSETGPCGLCVVAADRIYHIEDLQPIHDRCKCEVLPVIGAFDPGLSLNADELDAIYDAAGGTGGDVIKGGRRHSGALKRVRVALAEHGELGPVLVDADQQFRGPREVAKTKVADRATRARAELAALEDKFARLIRRREAGEDVERPLRWQANRIEALRRELAGAV